MSESATLDITEDLTRDQLSAVAFGTEVVVSWKTTDETIYGIIVGYDDKSQLFEIDPVIRTTEGWQDMPHHHLTMEDFGGDGWRRRSLQLDRDAFVVFGPANRDPGDKPETPVRPLSIEPGATLRGFDTLGQIAVDNRLNVFTDAVEGLLRVGMGDFCSNEPTFRVRLDIDAREVRAHELSDGPAYPRQYRILVRPVMGPIMHDELIALLSIAEQHGLAAFHGQHGIELRLPEDAID